MRVLRDITIPIVEASPVAILIAEASLIAISIEAQHQFLVISTGAKRSGEICFSLSRPAY
jgi:hypothetical protein